MLEINELTVAYGDKIALLDLTLQVGPGEILAVIGPNGAGKSTLIKAVSGILPATRGEIRLAGEVVDHHNGPLRARKTAVVPQGGYLPRAFTVRQTVMLGRTPYLGWLGRPQAADFRAVDQALEETRLADLQSRIVGELSGGEQQRVLLARALAQDTPVLLLDEPTTHLDLRHQAGILRLVQRLTREKDLAVLMVLHDLNHAGAFADRLALLVDGRLESEGRPWEVLTASNLAAVYGLTVHVAPHPMNGNPVVLLDGE